MIDMSALIPTGQPEVPTAPEQGNLMQNLKANIMARNTQPVNPMTNKELPGSLEEALMVIEDQKRIIQTLQAKMNPSSSQREMNA